MKSLLIRKYNKTKKTKNQKKTKKSRKNYLGGKVESELDLLRKELSQAKLQLKKAKQDWDNEAKDQDAQPDYSWVKQCEDNVDDLKQQIRDMKLLQGDTNTSSSSSSS